MEVVKTWQGTCEDCSHWKFEDKGYGHCGLFSCRCSQSTLEKTEKGEPKKPTNFLSWVDAPKEDGGLNEDGN